MSPEQSDQLFFVTVVSTACVTVAVTILLLFAALSPEISVDIPGISGCRSAGECGFSGGGGD
jgi:hypothetical protein